MAGEVLVDALPYIDQGYDDPGVRDAALAMVEEECRRYRPTKNYLEYLPALNMTAFETPLMLHEFDRISNRQPMEPLSMKRYELPPPPPGKTTDEPAWLDSVANSKAQLEHQSVRALNLELMLEYGCEAWKAHLEIFAALQAKAQLLQTELRRDVQDANWQRKSKQTATGERLRSLEAQWVALVSKNYEIEQACAKLEEIAAAYGDQVQQLQAEKEARDAERVEVEQRRERRAKVAKEEAEREAEAERRAQQSAAEEEGDKTPEENSSESAEVAIEAVAGNEDDVEMADVSNQATEE